MNGPIRSVVFVCHGNICRSPMAEFVLRKMLADKGLSGAVEVASRATSREEIWAGVGNPIYPPAAAELRRHGVPYDTDKRAEQFSDADCRRFDLVVAMDDNNVRNLLRMCPAVRPKMCKLLDLVDGGNVSDPWYTGDFEGVYRDIERGCRALVEQLCRPN